MVYDSSKMLRPVPKADFLKLRQKKRTRLVQLCCVCCRPMLDLYVDERTTKVCSKCDLEVISEPRPIVDTPTAEDERS